MGDNEASIKKRHLLVAKSDACLSSRCSQNKEDRNEINTDNWNYKSCLT